MHNPHTTLSTCREYFIDENNTIVGPKMMCPMIVYTTKTMSSSRKKCERSPMAREMVRVRIPMRGWKSSNLKIRSKNKNRFAPLMDT